MIGDDPLGKRRTASGLWETGEDEKRGFSPAQKPSESGPREKRSEGTRKSAEIGESAGAEAAANIKEDAEIDEGMTESVAPVEDELESARAEAAANRESWLRAAAELENYRRRTERELAETASRAQAEVLRSLLGVLDDVERALAAAGAPQSEPESERGGEPTADPIVTGIRLIRARLLDILRQYGVVEIEAEGALFDPHAHEAVMQLASTEVADGHVAQVLERGYRIGDRVLRPAKVAVAHAGSE